MTDDLQAFLDIEKQWKEAQLPVGIGAAANAGYHTNGNNNANNSTKRGDTPPPASSSSSSEDAMLTMVDSWAQLLADVCPAYGATATSLTHTFALHPTSPLPDPLSGSPYSATSDHGYLFVYMSSCISSPYLQRCPIPNHEPD